MPPRISTAAIKPSELNSYEFRGGFFQRISETLGINNTIPDKTRDVIKELTPDFIKNWRNKLLNFFGSDKTEK